MRTLKISDEYAVVWFPGETLENFEAVDERLTAEGFGAEKRTNNTELLNNVHYQALCVPATREWREKLDNAGLNAVFCSDRESTKRFGNVIGLPYVILDHFHQDLLFAGAAFGENTEQFSKDFRSSSGFLVHT